MLFCVILALVTGLALVHFVKILRLDGHQINASVMRPAESSFSLFAEYVAVLNCAIYQDVVMGLSPDAGRFIVHTAKHVCPDSCWPDVFIDLKMQIITKIRRLRTLSVAVPDYAPKRSFENPTRGSALVLAHQQHHNVSVLYQLAISPFSGGDLRCNVVGRGGPYFYHDPSAFCVDNRLALSPYDEQDNPATSHPSDRRPLVGVVKPLVIAVVTLFLVVAAGIFAFLATGRNFWSGVCNLVLCVLVWLCAIFLCASWGGTWWNLLHR